MSNIHRTKWYLVVIALLDFMGLGMVVAIFPHLLVDGNFLAHSQQSRLTVLGIFLAVYPLGQFFGAAILGRLSDSYGRKKLMVITLIGTCGAFISSGVAIMLGSALGLLLSRALAGVFAGNIAIAQASMADISTLVDKTKNLSLIQIALGLAWVVGPPLGGWSATIALFQQSGFVTAFWLMATLLFLALMYTLFFYQETLVPLKRNEKIHPLAGLAQVIQGFTNKNMRLPLLIWTIFVAGWWLFEAFLPLYLLKRFNFSSGAIGGFLASMGATYAVFQYLVVTKLAKRISPELMVKRSLIIAAVAVLGIAWVRNTFELHVVITLFVTAMGFALPGLITSISNLATKEQQGEIMGNISATQALATVLMMTIGGYLDTLGISITIISGGILLFVSWSIFMLRFKPQLKVMVV